MPTPKQWAIRDVAKASFYSISTGKPITYLTNLKTSGIENSAETVYARGGTGNAKIVGFSSNREANIALENAVFTNEVIAMMTGNALVEGAQNIYKRDEKAVASNATALSKTPVGDLIALYELNADGSHGQEFTKTASTLATGEYDITGKDVTFFAGDLVDGATIVAYYYIATDITSQTITISSDSFAGSFKLVLDCIVKNTADKQDYAAQIIVHNCKMEDNWSISLAAEGDPAVHSIPIEVLKPDNGTDMYTMTMFSEDLVV